jgi:uncharacterized membrane protein
MSEKLEIDVVANTDGANAALKKTQAATKAIGDEAVATSAKSKSAFDGLSRNIVPAAAAYAAVRLAMRGVREVMNELNAASKDDALVSGKLKESAMVAANSVQNLEIAFDRFKQTAVAAVAPVIGYIAEDLSGALNSTTKDLSQNTDAVETFANAWAVTKTVVSAVMDILTIGFTLLKGYLAASVMMVGELVKGFGYLASVVSNEVGDSLKDFGDILSNSGKQMMEEANDSFIKAGKSLGKALSGEMYEETMRGFDKYKQGIKEKAKELQAVRDAELAKKTAGGKATDVESREEKAKKAIAAEAEAYLLSEEKKRVAVSDTAAFWESRIADLGKLETKNANEEIARINAIAEAKEKAAQIAQEAIEQEAEAKARLAEEDLIRQRREDARLSGGEPGDVGAAGRAAMRPSLSDYEEPIIGPGAGEAMATPSDYEDQLNKEREQLLERVDFRQEHADRILEIEEQLAGGTIRVQNEAAMREARLNKTRVVSAQEMANGISGALGNLAVLMQSKNRTMFEIGRAAALAQNVIDTISSAASSFAFGSKIGGPVLGAAFAATAVAAGAVRASMLLSAQPSGGGGNMGGGYADTSNIGGPGDRSPGAGVGASSQVNVSLYGERFGADQVRGLIDAINSEAKDGKKVTVKV